jgi:NADH-quinone oxidoreductase subunit C
MSLSKEELIEMIQAIEPNAEPYEHRDQLTVKVSKDSIVNVAKELKESDKTSFDMLTDITAIDWNETSDRFDVVYFFWSNKYKQRVRLKVPVSENNCNCPTVTGIWESANWYEREVYDMYGIKFEGHPNLRRFYMPEDYNDPDSGEPIYPLRKDFPLMGIPDSLPLPPYPEREGLSS